MQTGLAGLVVWSFVMASAYGAGLTVIPTLQPICAAAAAVQATAGTPSTADRGAEAARPPKNECATKCDANSRYHHGAERLIGLDRHQR
jgi:hypothetical protein